MVQPLSIAIDLGGTQVRAALIDAGSIVRRAARRTDVQGGPLAILQQFGALVEEICTKEERSKVGSVGLCSPGPIDTTRGVTLGLPTLPGWVDFPLQKKLAELLGMQVIVENDAIAAAFGEWQFGAGRGLQHMIYLTISTGIGGGAIVDGRLLHGHKGMATHFGHMSISPTGPRCNCGGFGCFETMASGTALGEKARRVTTGHLSRLPHATAVDVVDGAHRGDAQCLALLNEEARLIGRGMASLVNLFSPERIVMGGGVSKGFDLMENDIHGVLQSEAMPPFRTVRVVAAQLEDNAGLMGVAALAQQALRAAGPA